MMHLMHSPQKKDSGLIASPRPWAVLLVSASAILQFLAAQAWAQGDTWSASVELKTPRRLLAAAAEDGKIYTFGGCGSPCFLPPLHTSTFEETRVEVFDPKTGTWTVRSPLPAIFFSGVAAAPGNGKIYLLGGVLTGNVLLEYNPAADSWTNRASMPTSRHGLAVVTYQGKLFAIGGSGLSNAVEIYDPASDTWIVGAPLPTPRIFLAAAEAGGKIYAIGGSPDCCGDSTTATVEAYDPKTDSWQTAADLPVALQVSAAAAVHGKIYVFGGHVPGSDSRDSTFEYDPETNTWTRLADMLSARDQAPAVAVDNKIYVLGGSINCHCRALNQNEEYTPPPVTVRPQPDLAIEITNGVTSVVAGQITTYRVMATNKVNSIDAEADVQIEFQKKLSRVTWCLVDEGEDQCNPSTSAAVSPIPLRLSLATGEARTYIVRGLVAETANNQLTTIATIEPAPSVGAADTDPRDNRSVDIDEIESMEPEVTTDLAISLTNQVDEVFDSTTTIYTIEARNRGPAAANGTTILFTSNKLADPRSQSRWCTAVNAGCPKPGEVGYPASCEPSEAGLINTQVDLDPSACTTFKVEGVVHDDPAAKGPATLVSQATITSPPGVFDTNLENNNAIDIDPILKIPPTTVTLTKTNGAASVIAGAETIYTLTVVLDSPTSLLGARVSDEFPPQLVHVRWCRALPPAMACDPATAPPLDDTVDLSPGVPVTYVIRGLVDAKATGRLINTATVILPTGEGDTDTDDDPILSEADLTITKTNGMDAVIACEPTTYRITVTNSGPSTARDVGVHDEFPPELLETRWCKASGPAECDPDLLGALDDTLELAPGESVLYLARGTVDAEGPRMIWNTATVTPPADVDDPVLANNSASDHDPITRRRADLEVSKTDGVEIVEPGETLTYTIVVSNMGPDDVEGARVLDAFPSGKLTDITWTCAASGAAICTELGAELIDDSVFLPAGSHVTYTATATVAPFFGGDDLLANTVTVTPPCNAPDPDTSNNSATDEDWIFFADCDRNGVDDGDEIATNSALDLNDDGVLDACQIGRLGWLIQGTAEGGTITVTIDGFQASCSVMVPTVAGQAAETVVSNVAAALNADLCLAGQGITAAVEDHVLYVIGFLINPARVTYTSTDAGLEHLEPIITIPTLSILGTWLLMLLLAALACRILAGQHRS